MFRTIESEYISLRLPYEIKFNYFNEDTCFCGRNLAGRHTERKAHLSSLWPDVFPLQPVVEAESLSFSLDTLCSRGRMFSGCFPLAFKHATCLQVSLTQL